MCKYLLPRSFSSSVDSSTFQLLPTLRQLYTTTYLWTSLGSISYAKGHVLCLFIHDCRYLLFIFYRIWGSYFSWMFCVCVYVYVCVCVCVDQRIVWGVFPQVLPSSSFVFKHRLPLWPGTCKDTAVWLASPRDPPACLCLHSAGMPSCGLLESRYWF